MMEDDCPRVSTSESVPSTDSSVTKQRKKRKWDQPAELLVSAGIAVPGVLPMGNMGSIVGIGLPGVVPASAAAASLMNLSPATYGTLKQVIPAPLLQQQAAALVQKIQPKIQEDLIAREIVINDAEPALRYKLTKRQTQDEIQKCTGSVVITRGKYRPPNAPPDGDKPLYLHISAGAHLETTVERIKAVDQAAAMVEEMLKSGSVNNGVLSTSVFLGFEPDPSLNITVRIRGPNDQYVNHIINETGATVLLKGRGSGYSGSANGEVQQPLHLFLSSSNPKSLEHAKLLAENLLDTICMECGASRVSSCKVYGAVPPPQQLLAGVQSSGNEVNDKNTFSTSSTSSIARSFPASAVSLSPCTTTVLSQGIVPQPSQSNIGCFPQTSLTGGTSYNGYGGIYPQATPLQQVALALRQSTSVASTVSPVINSASTSSTSDTSSERERLRRQKRKFQELPVASEGTLKHNQDFAQDSDILKPLEQTPQMSERNTSTMPAPKKLVQPSSNGMPPPPPPPLRMPPPPPKFNSPMPAAPPPKFKLPAQSPSSKVSSSAPVQEVNKNKIVKNSEPKIVPDTLISLLEYGDEDEDDEPEVTDGVLTSQSSVSQGAKPFWAV